MEYHSTYAPLVGHSIWTLMEEVVVKTRLMACCLVPPFLATSFCVKHAQMGMQGMSNRELIIASFTQGVCLSLFICYFQEVMFFLDKIVCLITDLLEVDGKMKAYLNKIASGFRNHSGSMAWVDAYQLQALAPSFSGTLCHWLSGGKLFLFRGMMHAMRSYLLIFWTQMGPIALAISALPGYFGRVAQTWFGVQFGLFIWGISLGLLDLMAIHLNLFANGGEEADWLKWMAALAMVLIYCIFATGVTVYMGSMAGRWGFSTAFHLLSHRMALVGNKWYR